MTTSTNKGYSLQSTGSNVGTWGDGPSTALNQGVFNIIDANLGGVVTKSLTNVNVTLSATEAQNLTVVLNGTLSGDVQITNPCIGFFYVDNQCTMAGHAITVTNGTGSPVSISNGGKIAIIADGTNGCRQVGAGVISVATGFGLSGGPITASGTASISSSVPPYGFDVPINLGIAASVAGSALTIAIKDQTGADPSSSNPVLIPFRNVSASVGTPTWLAATGALSMTVSSGSTLGTSNNIPFRIWLVMFNDGGTLRLGVINCLTSTGILPLYETSMASSIADTGAGTADSAGVFYTGTAVTSKAFRIIGYVEYINGLTNAGTWNATPDIMQLFGPGIKKPGDIVQFLYSESGAEQNTITGQQIAFSDSIPQNTQGKQMFTLSVTPTSKANRLIVESTLMLNGDSVGVAATALFQDSNANALAAIGTSINANEPKQAVMRHSMLANTSSSTTFNWRVGGSASGNIVTLNEIGRAHV